MSALRQDLNVAPQEIYANNVTTQGTDLGARMTTGDGRVFRYALGSAAALIQGRVYQSVAQDSTNLQNLAVLAAGTLTTAVTTSTTVTLSSNQLAGGLLSVGTSSGFGYTYRIKSHPSASAGTVTFTLEDPLQVALTTGSKIDVTPNPYNGVIIAPTYPLTGTIAGVASQAGTATGFVWIQTRGECAVYCDGAITVGQPVSPSGAISGAVMATNSGTQPVIGYAAITTTANKYAPIFLTLE